MLAGNTPFYGVNPEQVMKEVMNVSVDVRLLGRIERCPNETVFYARCKGFAQEIDEQKGGGKTWKQGRSGRG